MESPIVLGVEETGASCIAMLEVYVYLQCHRSQQLAKKNHDSGADIGIHIVFRNIQ